MAVQLSATDFRKLVSIVSNLDDFRNVAGRIRLVTGALEGSPRANDVLALINFDGSARSVAVDVIRRLSNFGRITKDKEALAIFLNELLFYKGDEDEDTGFIRRLFETYSLDKPIVSTPSIDEWRDIESDISVQEKIIGENTLRHIRVLQLALEAAKAVVHISTPKGYGTGFLVSHDLLMTNNHVIESTQVTLDCTFTFNYELDLENKLRETFVVSAKNEGLFYTNPILDYTIVQLEITSLIIQPLTPNSIRVNRDDRVAIIQHPGGHVKKISMQNNFVSYADDEVIQYTTSTMPGSSGSPVFNDEFQVIAVHHSGGLLSEPNTQRRYLRNAGTSIIAVLKDLRTNAPEIYKFLNL